VPGQNRGTQRNRPRKVDGDREPFAVRGAQKYLRSDNGPEKFVAKEFREWLARACISTRYILKASPWENGYVESFNGRLRDELLDRELFLSLPEARVVLGQWRVGYNHRWPLVLKQANANALPCHFGMGGSAHNSPLHRP